jgi:hypothetical protein
LQEAKKIILRAVRIFENVCIAEIFAILTPEHFNYWLRIKKILKTPRQYGGAF